MLREPKTQREFCLHRNKDGTLDFTGVLSGDSSGRRHLKHSSEIAKLPLLPRQYLSVFRNWNCDENGDVLG